MNVTVTSYCSGGSTRSLVRTEGLRLRDYFHTLLPTCLPIYLPRIGLISTVPIELWVDASRVTFSLQG